MLLEYAKNEEVSHFADFLLVLCLCVCVCMCASSHVCECGLVLSGLIKMPSAIWKMTAVGSQGVHRSGREAAPCSRSSQFEHSFKKKVYILSDLE